MRPISEQLKMLFHYYRNDLQKQLSDCREHALLTSRELEEAKSTMYNYILIIGKALEHRFPELDFIVQNTAFLDPAMRSMQRPDIEALKCKFDTGKEPTFSPPSTEFMKTMLQLIFNINFVTKIM